MTRGETATEYFKQGYNCTQAVVLAFSDLIDLDKDTLMKLSSSFGGGMGRLREVCGSVSGAFIVLGLLYGYSGPEKGQVKADHYANIQYIAGEFEKKYGSIVCRELLGLKAGHDSPTPTPRTDEFYKKRPCVELIASSADILDAFIKEKYNAH